MLWCSPKILSMQRWPKSSDLPMTLSVGDQLNALCLGSTLAVGKVEAALIHLGKTSTLSSTVAWYSSQI